MLPLDNRMRGGYHDNSLSSSNFREYFKRMLDVSQMDFKVTYYQMVTLLTSPTKVYRNAQFRKQTKNRWARDDPAFAVIQVFFLIVCAIAYGIAFRLNTISAYLSLIAHFVLIHWLATGLIMASIGRFVANKYLRVQINSAQGPRDNFFVEQAVEWQYAFDIHCNSFFVMFMGLYILQYIFGPLLLSGSFIATAFANSLYAACFAVYFYITFLGYMVLPFLHKTEFFLYPIVVTGFLYITSIGLQFVGLGINVARVLAYFYFG